MRTTTLFILTTVMLIMTNCSSKSDKISEETDEALTVMTFEATETTFTDILEFSGTIYANKEANVGSSIPGKVEKIHYRPGQWVKEGALLVSMSSEMLMMTEVEYKTLEKDFERVSRLREKGSISEQDYDHVKAKFDAACYKYEMTLKNTQILAPFSGIVTDIIVQEGENFMFSPSLDLNFSMTSGIVKLMQINPVTVKFSLNEKLISQIKTGTPVSITCDAYPGKNYNGKVSLIHPKFNPMTRSTEVEVSVLNPSGELKPGMFARLSIEGMKTTGCSVPITSIVNRKGKEYVWITEGNKAHLIEIERLAMKGEYAVVTGIEPGTQIIISRKSQLSEGTVVQINNNQ